MTELYGIVCRKYNMAMKSLDSKDISYNTVGYSKSLEARLKLEIKRRLEFPILKHDGKYYVGIGKILKFVDSQVK